MAGTLLSAAGVPVYAELGQTGGFQLLDGYRGRLTGLDSREGEALLLLGLPGPAAALGLGEASERTRLKLLASMPESNRIDALRVASRFHLDPTGWFQGAERIGLLPDLAVAVWGNRMIRIGYASWKAEVERKLGPLGIVLKAGLGACRSGWHGIPDVSDCEHTKPGGVGRQFCLATRIQPCQALGAFRS